MLCFKTMNITLNILLLSHKSLVNALLQYSNVTLPVTKWHEYRESGRSIDNFEGK